MRKYLVFFQLYMKRLILKKAYIFILLLMVAVAVIFSSATKGNLEKTSIGVVINEDSELSNIIWTKLNEYDRSISFLKLSSVREAEELVDNGQLSGCVILAEDLTDKLNKLVVKGHSEPYVTMLVRDDQGLDKLMTLRVASILYPEVVDLYYSYAVNNAVGNYQDASYGKETLEYYKSIFLKDQIVDVKYIQSEDGENSIIVSPLRGILACFVILLGISGILLFYEDEAGGLFVWFKDKQHFILEIIYILVPMLLGSLVMELTMLLLGEFKAPLFEIINILGLIISGLGLGIIIKVFTKKLTTVGVIIPNIMICMMLSAPVFIDISALRIFSYVFPVSHYLYAQNDHTFSGVMLLYGVFLTCIAYVKFLLEQRYNEA